MILRTILVFLFIPFTPFSPSLIVYAETNGAVALPNNAQNNIYPYFELCFTASETETESNITQVTFVLAWKSIYKLKSLSIYSQITGKNQQ